MTLVAGGCNERFGLRDITLAFRDLSPIDVAHRHLLTHVASPVVAFTRDRGLSAINSTGLLI